MTDVIYIVDTATKEPTPIQAVSFYSIGIQERADLEEWIIRHPQMLGEDLLIVTSEYDKFDKSNKRLDVLALDKTGKLVVVELKLDAKDSLAELQAIRYAAFCSTMTMDDVVEEMARFTQESREHAADAIRSFLETDELPELDRKPRILIAAGSMNDQELTSTALWLRTFNLDISCVELTPYKLHESERVLLVPRVVIPIAEAKEYLVSVERKEAAEQQAKQQQQQATSAVDNMPLWQAIISSFNALGSEFQPDKPRRWYIQVQTGYPGVHWEWMYRSPTLLDVALHFETGDPDNNHRWCSVVEAHKSAIQSGLPYRLERAARKRWGDLHFSLSSPEDQPVGETAAAAANLMKVLIERTYPLVHEAISDQAKDETLTPPNTSSLAAL